MHNLIIMGKEQRKRIVAKVAKFTKYVLSDIISGGRQTMTMKRLNIYNYTNTMRQTGKPAGNQANKTDRPGFRWSVWPGIGQYVDGSG